MRLLLCPILIVLLAMGACSKKAAPPAPATPSVTVALPMSKKLTEWDEFTGRLGPVASVEVRARVGGYLESTHFVDGAEVKQGDLLFVIDPRRPSAELSRAKAELIRAQTTLELAVNEDKRARRLVETRSISAEEADAKTTARKGAEAALAATQAALDAAELEVQFTRVTAPISGRIGRKLVTEGNLITSALVLTTIVSLDPIYCYFDVDERSALKYRELVRQGKRQSALSQTIPAEMGLADESHFPHQGKIDFIENELSTSTGSIRTRGVFPNPDHLMLPGFFARVRIPGSGEYQAMLIRDSAIGSDQGQAYVYVIDGNERASQRHVTLGPVENGLRVIREGLSPGDRVVINGMMAIRPGSTVVATEAPMAPRNTAASSP